jgi:hypothetical protein|nr:MAG TPA: hypothetical protein [Caudoviricetes sp.]
MSKITYTDKVALNINQDVADVNKCNATDLNEIKQVVNENDDLVGILENLTTQDKTSIVNAINEVNQNDINKSTYSTTEKVVGKWINGKPLYRKVINFTTTISADTTLEINHGVNNVEMIWFDPIGCFMWASSGLGYNIPMIGYSGNITDKLYTFVDKTKISIHANGSWGTIWTKYITLLYTKTTD